MYTRQLDGLVGGDVRIGGSSLGSGPASSLTHVNMGGEGGFWG